MQKEIELLAPAGTWEALEAAVNAGADAVYLGGKAFGARAYASNFDREEMAKAVYFCHMHHVTALLSRTWASSGRRSNWCRGCLCMLPPR